MKKTKVLTILGTRPEIIRLSETIKKFDKFFDHKIVHTGQNYDYELNQIFFKDLNLRKPDYFLNIDTNSLGRAMGEILIKIEEVLIKEKPNAVLILGDTNSSISAIIAKRMKIPIFHMEAGNRSFDMNVPEEINRKIVDHISDFNLVYTEHARRHLISEGISHRRIYLTGSPMNEVIQKNLKKINSSNILSDLGLVKNNYFIVSFHRQENVDNKNNLNQIIKALNSIAKLYKLPVIVSTHPRTKDRLSKLGSKKFSKLISFLNPFGFSDYLCLQKFSKLVISDSGTISEESAILKFPAISLRNSMERPEAQDCGILCLSGLNPQNIINCINAELNLDIHERDIPQEYQISDTSNRVLKLVQGNSSISNLWWGIDN